ncbi:hypothetical protein EZV62_010114 [Acer yangbiense]|uniref:O-methyltransferase C-terminal domain-containing protein n=1 Tax=Acer yangbiense TaxID=1000413 RepID=A0A5C7I1R8_9ROSI|nr:hypothetical protein EZV62_010114 [Acer yangbiense]
METQPKPKLNKEEDEEEAFSYAMQLASQSWFCCKALCFRDCIPHVFRERTHHAVSDPLAPGYPKSCQLLRRRWLGEPLQFDSRLKILCSFQLKDAVLEGGIPFDRVHGTNAFEYPGLDSRGFENLKQLVDVGGGLGVTLKAITTKYPHIKVINFDLPHVIQHASHSPGVLEHVGGDMFESVPESEAIFLKNCYKAIPDDGKVIVVEAVVLEIPEASAAAKTTSQIDVILMTQNPGGKERTRQEFTSLATVAGFSAIRFDCFACNFCVMELYK